MTIVRPTIRLTLPNVILHLVGLVPLCTFVPRCSVLTKACPSRAHALSWWPEVGSGIGEKDVLKIAVEGHDARLGRNTRRSSVTAMYISGVRETSGNIPIYESRAPKVAGLAFLSIFGRK